MQFVADCGQGSNSISPPGHAADRTVDKCGFVNMARHIGVQVRDCATC